MEAQNHALLCQEIESELRELCLECRKRSPSIKEYTERAILKIRHHRDLVEKAGGSSELPEFPLHEVLKSLLMACETFQNKIVLISLSCLQRLIHRRVLKDETVAIVINLMKEQAMSGDEQIQLKVLQTIMATPAHMTLVNELVVEQLLQLLYVLHNSANVRVHHTACAGLRQLAGALSDRATAVAIENQLPEAERLEKLAKVGPVLEQAPSALPTLTPIPAPLALQHLPPLKMMYIFVQDLCVMVDYDASSLSSRYASDAGERMRIGLREGYWLASIKFPRPLCLELLGASVEAHPEFFMTVPECFELLRHGVCAVLLKNLRGCFDFAILIRSIHLLQQILKCPQLAALLIPEINVFLQLMMDLTTAEKSPWQRATSLEFLISVCEDVSLLAVLHEHVTFKELVNSLSKLMHQVCFASGMDSATLLQSAAGSATRDIANAQRGSGESAGTLLGRGGNLPGALSVVTSLPSFGMSATCSARDLTFTGPQSARRDGNSSNGSNASPQRGNAARCKLLLLMSDAEPPTIQPTLLVASVVECVFAIVSSLYKLLLDACGEPSALSASAAPATNQVSGTTGSGAAATGTTGLMCSPLTGSLTDAQERCRGMVSDSWASLLSAVSLLLSFAHDESLLLQALHCVQTLIYICGRLGLEDARDACLLQVSRYAVPSQSHEDSENASGLAYGGAGTSRELSAKSVLCFKCLLNFCYSFGSLLGVGGWKITLRAFDGLERALQKASPVQTQELSQLQLSLDSLFETAALLPADALCMIVKAAGDNARNLAEGDDGAVLERLVHLCTFNLARLHVVWESVLQIVLDMCSSDLRGDIRGKAAKALCRILGQALRKGVAIGDNQEKAQKDLLQPLEALLHVPHEDARARVCEGLLAILQASGQELQPAAWGTIIQLVEIGAKVELQRAGLEFYLPAGVDHLCPQTQEPSVVESSSEPKTRSTARSSTGIGADGREHFGVLPTVFSLLELIVHDFMEYAPPTSVPKLTASISAFARFNGLGVNSSLTAVGFLWNVADALALYHCASSSPPLVTQPQPSLPQASAAQPSEEPSGNPDELWIQIFTHLRVLAVDGRPEVRNCAVKSLTSALLAHGRKVGSSCYERCLRDILIPVLVEIQAAPQRARKKQNGESKSPEKDGGNLLVHHSRDTLEKQWDETMLLGVDNVRRVLSHFSEDSTVEAFAPLAYSLLLQIQASLQTLSAEVSSASLRALVDLMRTPASQRAFDARSTLKLVEELPAPGGFISIWRLGWSVLWRLVHFCSKRTLPEPFLATFASSLSMLRNSHRHVFTPSDNLIMLQLSLVLVTSPSFYLSTAQLQLPGEVETSNASLYDHNAALREAVQSCAREVEGIRKAAAPGSECALAEEDREVFAFVENSGDTLWNLTVRTELCSTKGYSKAHVPMKNFIDKNSSRNVAIKSMESALHAHEAEFPTEESIQAFLAPSQSPMHRNMLHICSAKLALEQSNLFGLLEETHSFAQPFLEVLFLCQLCSVFLDTKKVLLDSNKIALASRTLCVIVLFCRRLVFLNVAGFLRAARIEPTATAAVKSPCPASGTEAKAHLESYIGVVPHLCRVIQALASCRQGCQPRPPLRGSGLWKLAIEALLYIIEDALAAIEHCSLETRLTDAFWDSAMNTLEDAVASVKQTELPQAGDTDDVDTLLQAIGNLISHRILSCKGAPPRVSERAVRLLGDLVGFPKDPAASDSTSDTARPLSECSTLGQLFDLCARPAGSSAEICENSVAAMCAGTDGAPLRGVQLASRPSLLASVVPSLLARLRKILGDYGEAAKETAPADLLKVLRFALSRLKALRVDPEEFLAAAPEITGKARSACQLAGGSCCTMALLPHLTELVTTSDLEVRTSVREVLEDLSIELGLSAGRDVNI